MANYQAREPISRDRVPFYVFLAEELKYSWAGDYLKHEGKLIEVNRLTKELSEAKSVDPAFPEFAARVIRSYDGYREARVENIAKRLYGLLQSPDPMAGFNRAQNATRFEIIERSVIEEALAYIEANYSGGVTADEKQKEVTRIEKLIAKRQAEMLELLPPKQFVTNDPASNREINKAECLVDFWRELATWTIGPVSPRGRALRLSPEEEQKAFYTLGLDKLTSRAARLEPFGE
jgi:hypothetical protein